MHTRQLPPSNSTSQFVSSALGVLQRMIQTKRNQLHNESRNTKNMINTPKLCHVPQKCHRAHHRAAPQG